MIYPQLMNLVNNGIENHQDSLSIGERIQSPTF